MNETSITEEYEYVVPEKKYKSYRQICPYCRSEINGGVAGTYLGSPMGFRTGNCKCGSWSTGERDAYISYKDDVFRKYKPFPKDTEVKPL